jgi:hypothetical protein
MKEIQIVQVNIKEIWNLSMKNKTKMMIIMHGKKSSNKIDYPINNL